MIIKGWKPLVISVLILVLFGPPTTHVLGQACAPSAQPLQGDVNVKSREYRPFLVTDSDKFFAGEKLSVNAQGQIDVNYVEHHDRHCNIVGIFDCHTDDWTQHNFKTPNDERLVLKLVDDSGNAPPDGPTEYQIGTSDQVIDVPATPFDKPYHLEAWIADPNINGSVSSGQYTVSVTVDASGRNAALAGFLSQAPPPRAEQIDVPLVLDLNLLRSCNASVATQIAEHAKAFPAKSADMQEAHLAVLRLALKLDPSNPTITLALADFYRQTGSLALAKKTAADTLEATEKAMAANPSRENRQNRASAALLVGKTIEAERASLNPSDLQDALTYYAKSAADFKEDLDVTGSAEALFREAQALRLMRTDSSLAAAVKIYQELLGILPHRLNDVQFLNVSPDGKFLLASKGKSNLAIAKLGEDLSRIEHTDGYSAVSQDETGTLLVRNQNSMFWYEPDHPDNPPTLATSKVLINAITFKKTILGVTNDHSLIMITPQGIDHEVFKNDKGLYPLYTLATDGATYAFLALDNSIVVRKSGTTTDTDLRTIKLPDLQAFWMFALSPDGTKVAALISTKDKNIIRLWQTNGDSGADEVFSSDRYDGTKPIVPAALSFSPDGSTLTFSTKVGEIDLASVEAPHKLHSYKIESTSDIKSVNWLTNTQMILTTFPTSYYRLDLSSNSVAQINLEIYASPFSFPFGFPFFYAGVNGTRVVTTQSSSHLQCYTMPDGALKWDNTFPNLDSHTSIILNGGHFVVSGTQDGKALEVIDILTGNIKTFHFETNLGQFVMPGPTDDEWFIESNHTDRSLIIDQFTGQESVNSFKFSPPVVRFGQSVTEVEKNDASVVNGAAYWSIVPAYGKDAGSFAVIPWINLPQTIVKAIYMKLSLESARSEKPCTVENSSPLTPRLLVPVVTFTAKGDYNCTDIFVPTGLSLLGYSSAQNGHTLAAGGDGGVYLNSTHDPPQVKPLTPPGGHLLGVTESDTGDRVAVASQTGPTSYSINLYSIAGDGSATALPCSACSQIQVVAYRNLVGNNITDNPFFALWPLEPLFRMIFSSNRLTKFTLLLGDEIAVQDIEANSQKLSIAIVEPVFQNDDYILIRRGNDLEILRLE